MEGRIKINTVMKLAAVLGYPKVTQSQQMVDFQQ